MVQTAIPSAVAVERVAPVSGRIPNLSTDWLSIRQKMKKGKRHAGVDIWTNANEPVSAPEPGVIYSASDHGAHAGHWKDYGPVGVGLKTDGGDYLWFSHMGSKTVSMGDRVTREQNLGTVKDWGTNSHLHFEVRTQPFYKGYGDEPFMWPMTLDPIAWLEGKKITADAGVSRLATKLRLRDKYPYKIERGEIIMAPEVIRHTWWYWGVAGAVLIALVVVVLILIKAKTKR